MRKLRRGIERNQRRKKIAYKAIATMLAASIGVSDATMIAYAQVNEDNSNGGDMGEGSDGASQENTEESGEESNGNSQADENSEESNETGEETEEEESEEETEEDSEEDEETEEEEDSEEDEEEESEEEDEEGEGKEKVKKSAPKKATMLRSLGSQAPEPAHETLRPETGTTVNITDVNITNGTIDVEIDNSGTYTLTGSNERNGAYVDVCIHVASQATVDLYFNGLNIVNDDSLDDAKQTTSYGYSDSISPIVVDGTVNLHISGDSTIAAVSEYFTVNGTLNFVGDTEGGTLTASASKILPRLMEPQVTAGNGEIHYQGGKVVIKTSTASNEAYTEMYSTCKIYFESTNAVFEGNIKLKNVYTSLSSLDGINWGDASYELYDLAGKQKNIVNLSGLTAAGWQIIQVNEVDENKNIVSMNLCDDLYVAGDGSVNGLIVGSDYTNYMFVRSEGTVKGYQVFTCNLYSELESSIYQVTFLDKDNGNAEITKYYVESGCGVYWPEESDDYTYKYTLANDEDVAKDSKVTNDMTIYVSKVEKGKVNITVDGISRTVNYGVTFGSLGLTGYYKDASTGKLMLPDDRITESRNFVKVMLETQTRDGKEFFKISSSDNLKEFAELVNAGSRNINGYLTTDITVGSDFPMIGYMQIGGSGNFFGTVEKDNSYTGTFDGQDHTVTLNDLSGTEASIGLFRYVSSGAVIKNITTEGNVSGSKSVGGLVGEAFCNDGGGVTIERCFNYAKVTTTNESQLCVGGIVGMLSAVYYGNRSMPLKISYCGNIGEASNGIVGSYDAGNIYISNCYNAYESNMVGTSSASISNSYSRVADEARGIEKSAEAFSSGEVAYLLNRGASEDKWRQTCGSGTPKLSGAMVYAGYNSCTDEDLSYSNTQFEHTVKGHNDKHAYRYADGKIIAGCEFCDTDITADICCDSEEAGSALTGVTVTYSDEWLEADYPDIAIKYSAEEDGEYLADQPYDVGTWYLKAYVGETQQEVVIDDTYTINPKKVVKKDDGDSYTAPVIGSVVEKITGSSANSGVNETYINGLIEQINTFSQQNKANGEESQQIIEYKGNSIPSSLIEALAASKGTVLHYTGTYMGKKYDFMIQGGEDFFINKNVKYYGPLYIQFLMTIQKLRQMGLTKIVAALLQLQSHQ